jgi:hypothetical protein
MNVLGTKFNGNPSNILGNKTQSQMDVLSVTDPPVSTIHPEHPPPPPHRTIHSAIWKLLIESLYLSVFTDKGRKV